MRRSQRGVVKLVIIAIAAVFVLIAGIRARFGGGRHLPDLTTAPVLPPTALQTVVDLDYPPGNVAVSADGRVFFTLHPDGNPPNKVLELVDGRPVPYPNEAYQHEAADIPWFQTILSLRIDRQGKLWVLDFADFGRGRPRITAFDLESGALVHQYEFPKDVAGFGSMLNDFQVSPNGVKIYIAETSPIFQRPALIVYDTLRKTSRRVLDRHPSVMAQNYVIQAPGRDMVAYGLVTLRIGVDSIALDKRGEWLYYGAVNGDRLWRIRAADLDNEALSAEELALKVEEFGQKTLSDGLTMDTENGVYLSDMEHSAIVRMAPDGSLTTLLKDPRLRWPDGFSFGPDGWLYVTCSSLQHVLFVGGDEMRANAPYQIFRFQPGVPGIPGH